MTGPLKPPVPSSQAEDSSSRPANQPQPQPGQPSGATGWGPGKAQRKRPLPPVGSDAPNRWLTSDPPGDIDALRSTSSLGHRTRPTRGARTRFRIGVVPMIAFIVAGAALAAWQMGLLDSFFSSTPDLQAALNNAGYNSITATVDGDAATLTGVVGSQADLNQVATVALSVDGIRQVDNQVIVEATDEVETLEGRIHAALSAAGFGDLTVAVNGDIATIAGTVADEESLDAAALAILDVPGVAQVDNRLVIGAVVPSADVQAALAAALGADEFVYVSFEAHDGLVVLKGAVATEEARSQAASSVLGVEGIDKIDNRLTIDGSLPIGPALPPEQLEAAAATALASAGIRTVTATVDGRRAVLDGTVPLETLGSGFFAFVETAETAVLSVDGIDQVSSRLTLRGDGAILRNDLQALLKATPVEFALGSADLTAESQAVLDQAALIIQSQPGLQVLIAGHTDAAGSNETNEALARQRAGAVLNYLLIRGVPPYRLVAVSYGELFPDQESTAEQNRRIDFEVGP